jgi:exodeoxyribonuclease VII small subunit
VNERLRDANLPADHFSAWEALAANGTFEEALDALESIVRLLDEGNLALDDSVRCFEIGTRLSNRCQDLLDAAELRISILTAAPEYDDEDQADPWLVKP